MSIPADPHGTRAIFERIQASVRDSARDGGRELSFQAMGTACRVFWISPASRNSVVASGIIDWVARFEAKYSRFWPQSLVSRINASAGGDWTALDAEAERLFALCHELHFLTRGSFDPSALPLLRLWDWKRNHHRLPEPTEVDAARSLVGWAKVQRQPGRIRLPEAGMGLDLGGMGKEFAVDQVLQWMRQNGAASALVDFGADVRVDGPPPAGRTAWHIGLENPGRPGSAWTGLGLKSGAVATSGDYHRKFELQGVRYGHIVDVKQGRPALHDIRAVSVVAPSCTQAGMLSTTAFALGPVEGLRLIETTAGVAGVILTEHQTLASRRFYEYVVS